MLDGLRQLKTKCLFLNYYRFLYWAFISLLSITNGSFSGILYGSYVQQMRLLYMQSCPFCYRFSDSHIFGFPVMNDPKLLAYTIFSLGYYYWHLF